MKKVYIVLNVFSLSFDDHLINGHPPPQVFINIILMEVTKKHLVPKMYYCNSTVSSVLSHIGINSVLKYNLMPIWLQTVGMFLQVLTNEIDTFI